MRFKPAKPQWEIAEERIPSSGTYHVPVTVVPSGVVHDAEDRHQAQQLASGLGIGTPYKVHMDLESDFFEQKANKTLE